MSYITDFVQSLRARGCRDETVKLRRYHVARAIEDLGKPNTWSRRAVEAYLANAGWSPATRRSVHASLKAFMRTLDDVEGAGVLEDIPAPRVPRGVPRPLEDTAIRGALARADERTSLMVELMAYGGLRRGEVARVRGRRGVDLNGLAAGDERHRVFRCHTTVGRAHLCTLAVKGPWIQCLARTEPH